MEYAKRAMEMDEILRGYSDVIEVLEKSQNWTLFDCKYINMASGQKVELEFKDHTNEDDENRTDADYVSITIKRFTKPISHL